MLIFLEGQALQKRDCPSKIGTVDNYEILAIMYYWHCEVYVYTCWHIQYHMHFPFSSTRPTSFVSKIFYLNSAYGMNYLWHMCPY